MPVCKLSRKEGELKMPWINEEKCRGCKICVKVCMFKAIKFEDRKAKIEQKDCVGCGHCTNNICPFEAIQE